MKLPWNGLGVLLCAAHLVAAHAWSSGSSRSATSQGFDAPPPGATTLLVLSAQRATAAASVLWVVVVQRLGDRKYVGLGAPRLEEWIERIQVLEPRLETPPLFGALALMGAGRPAAADVILARAEMARPAAFEPPYYRAVNAFFGARDVGSAIAHLRRAAPLPRAPAFLGRWADRLEKQQQSCAAVLDDLQMLKASDSNAFGAVSVESVFVTCVAREVERALAAYRIRFQRPAESIDQLVEHGFLDAPPPHPPGKCWNLEATVAKLVPCP